MKRQKFYLSPENLSTANDFYVSETFDSGEIGMQWDRLKLETPSRNIRVSVYIYDGEEDSENIIQSKFGDVLLFSNGTKGRYLRFEVYGKFNAYALSFPKQSFAEFLPAVYQNNELLERYLAVFQNLYLDTEAVIDGFYKELDPMRGSINAELVQWLEAEDFLGLPNRLLSITGLLYRLKGTSNCIKLLIYALTGEMPVIEEMSFKYFRLLMKNRPDIGEERLKKLITRFVPVGVRFKIIYPDEIGLYILGMNSVLADAKPVIVGEAFLGGNYAL